MAGTKFDTDEPSVPFAYARRVSWGVSMTVYYENGNPETYRFEGEGSEQQANNWCRISQVNIIWK